MGLIVNFSDFENISASGLSLNDYIIGYKSGPNREIRTTIADLINFLESASANDLYLVLSPNSAKWNSTYTTVNSLSDSWEESAFITPLQVASASWDSVYSTTQTNSSFWSDAYTNLVNNSANYLSAADLSLLATTSASWDSVYSTTNTNSSNWNYTYNTRSLYLPLSGGRLTGLVTSTSSMSSLSTIIANNFATHNQIQYLTAGTVRVYQFYNSLTDSLDTVFN